MKKKTCMLAVAIAATFNANAVPYNEGTHFCFFVKNLEGDRVEVVDYSQEADWWFCDTIKSFTNGDKTSGVMSYINSDGYKSEDRFCNLTDEPSYNTGSDCSESISKTNSDRNGSGSVKEVSELPPIKTSGSSSGGSSSGGGGGGGGAGIAIGAIGVIGLAVYALSPNSSSEFTPHFSYEGDIEYGGELKWTADNVGGVLSVDNLQNYSASIGYTANNFSIDLESDGIGYSVSTRYQYGMSRNWSLIPTANYSDTRQSFSLKLTKELK